MLKKEGKSVNNTVKDPVEDRIWRQAKVINQNLTNPLSRV